VLEQEFNIISGVTDLIVTHAGAEAYEPLYLAAMGLAGETRHAATSKDKFVRFGQEGALGGVGHLYLNVSWTFPSLTNDEVAVLTERMDAGTNMMIAGQDIGWDQSGASGSYGTPATQAFYASRMHATFVDDGSTANSSVDFVDTDAVFGAVPTSAVATTVYGSSTCYPEVIQPIAPATAVFNYNSNANLVGGIRCQTSAYKMVYFGIAPEQLANADAGKAMVRLSHDWFHGTTGLDQQEAWMAGVLGQAFPAPAADRVYIPVGAMAHAGNLEVFDAMGRSVLQQRITGGTIASLDVSSWAPGLYRYALRSEHGLAPAKAFIVAR
jgi:hypothetical protein